MDTEQKESGRLNQAARLAGMLMGGVFLVAGAVKTWEPVLFFWETVPYTYMLSLGPDVSPFAARVALLLGPVEVGLGLALLFHWQARWIYPVATALMTFFLITVTLGWSKGYDGSCGCFGTLVERGAGEAVVEDAIMLGLLIFAWWGTRFVRPVVWTRWAVVGGTVLALFMAGVRFYPDRDRIESSDLQAGVELKDLKVQDVDLMVGHYLIAVISPKCAYCQRATLRLNQYVGLKGMPPIVGLTGYAQDSEILQAFKKDLKPRFTIATVSGKDFMRLAWAHGYPRFAYLKNGVVEAVWEYHTFPKREEIQALNEEL